MTDKEIKKELKVIGENIQSHNETIARLEKSASDLVKDKNYKIVGNYNGQPYGKSRPSLKGKIFTVINGYDLSFHDWSMSWTMTPYRSPACNNCSCDLDDIEFLEE